MGLAARPACAAVQEIHVLGQGVDHDSYKAADLALDYARKRAVYLLAVKMQVPNADIKCAALTDDQLAQIIRGATVLETKRVGDITYEDVTVTLIDDALITALKIEKPKTLDLDNAASKGVLLLPVLAGKARAYVWEDDNKLMAPARDEAMGLSHGAVIVPAGDFDDRRLVDYQNALQVKADELAPMFKRYGVDEIVIAIVTPGDEGTTTPTTILLRRLQLPPRDSRTEQASLTPDNASDTQAMRLSQVAKALASTATQIATATSEFQQDKLKTAPSVTISFHYTTAAELAAMEEAVRNAPGALHLEIPSIALGNITGTLYFNGATRDIVRNAVAKQGFFVRDSGQGWVISAH